eukprot:TRINITY_DN2101_c1_g1_i1.p2 TRINITY_DN2101_c1_g1~~TRINITY_DN2101_c1_g1_i1.p2  ORF type:complete len:150 (-),score=27.26 TRINITY_DN2101_c1_g1_i1:283-732(-)
MTSSSETSSEKKVASLMPKLGASGLVFIGNVNNALNDDDMRAVFSSFGPIISCTNSKDTHSNTKRFCIEYADPEHAKMALESMNNFELVDKRMMVAATPAGATPPASAQSSSLLTTTTPTSLSLSFPISTATTSTVISTESKTEETKKV